MKLLLYCTKSKPYLVDLRKYPQYIKNCGLSDINTEWTNLNGKIVAECDFEVEKMGLDTGKGLEFDKGFNEESQLELFEIAKYVGNNYYYAIHIKNLHIFDKPKELGDYYTLPKKMNTFYGCTYVSASLDKAPQNMMYVVDDNEEKKVLISIQPQWLCKILNGEKTIEIRKKLLKEMLKNE